MTFSFGETDPSTRLRLGRDDRGRATVQEKGRCINRSRRCRSERSTAESKMTFSFGETDPSARLRLGRDDRGRTTVQKKGTAQRPFPTG